MITLRQPLTLAECEQVREWRNDPSVLPMLRTGYKTKDDQVRFYRDVIVVDRPRDHEYYAIDADGAFVGMGGLTYLTRVSGEISLILSPDVRGSGFGRMAVDALLEEAGRLGLTSVTGECYATGNLPFWAKEIVRRPARLTWEWTL